MPALLICYLVNGAIEWLEKYQDTPLDEVLAEEVPATSTSTLSDPTETAASLVCNDCGKKFRSQQAAEFHASKSGHVDFSESTEEIASLTEEEKKTKLAELRERAAAKKAAASVEDKEAQKRNEQIKRKATKETADLKEDMAKKEVIKEAEAKRREKQADVVAKEKIRAKIAHDKEARRLKSESEKAARSGTAVLEASTSSVPALATSLGPTTSKPVSAYTETRLRLQTPSGNVLKSFPVDTTLFEVAAALGQENGTQASSFMQNYPKKLFDGTEFGMTLKELGLVPSASLIVR